VVLVLSRKKNEQIVIDDRIVVTVLRIRGETVRFGIEAPKDVAVHRKEVYEAIKKGKEGLGAMAAPSGRGDSRD
jgi:carbon storage regulator